MINYIILLSRDRLDYKTTKINIKVYIIIEW